jgi:hypothetical protein
VAEIRNTPGTLAGGETNLSFGKPFEYDGIAKDIETQIHQLSLDKP